MYDDPLARSTVVAKPADRMTSQQSDGAKASALIAQLKSRREASYAHFMSLRTKVSSHPESVLGIRMKWLRQAVRQLAPLLTLETAIELLQERANAWYEYKIILGGVLGRIASASEGLPLLYPLCDGWAVPDYYKEIVAGWAATSETERAIVLDSLADHAHDPNPYARRLTVVTWIDLLRNSLATPTAALEHVIPLQDDEEYYVQMAIAWLLAEMTLTASPGDTSLTAAIERQITSSTILRMYRQKLRDSFRRQEPSVK